MNSLPTASQINNCIVTVRSQKVILDADLAEFYGVPVKRLNEQLSRNLNKFPADFAFQLSFVEWATLRSQIAAAQAQAAESQKPLSNWSQFATSSRLIRSCARSCCRPNPNAAKSASTPLARKQVTLAKPDPVANKYQPQRAQRAQRKKNGFAIFAFSAVKINP